MCGIVCFIGRSNGIDHVLDALQLLEYRAPDSAGLAVVGADGQLAVRRCLGAGRQLRAAIAEDPLAVGAQKGQIVVGHGRWAMVGAVTVANAHPIADRSRNRVVVENGSHNASLMLATWAEQEAWWQERGVPHPVHKTQNTTEVLPYEWERMVHLLGEEAPPAGSDDFLSRLDEHHIFDPEERALRLAAWRLRQGNAHACAFYSRHRPDTLYLTSHNKPLAIAIRNDAGGRELMVASDVNAALMLWPRSEVDQAAAQIEQLRAAGASQDRIQAISNRFALDVIFLDGHTGQGQELFARIDNQAEGPRVYLTHYDGSPLALTPARLHLNPAMTGRQGHPTYTESHVAEIPTVIDAVVETYVRDGRIAMAGVWQDGELLGAGINLPQLQRRFGQGLERLHRLLLVGEGSSWRDAQAAALLLRHVLPAVSVNVYRPVEMLNLGHTVHPAHDLAVEISWSGTTDSLLKVDAWLGELDVTRLAVTGRPQSDLARRTAASGGVLDVRSGIEVSVATVKGYQAILMTLYLLALQLAQLISEQSTAIAQPSPVVGRPSPVSDQLSQLLTELTQVLPHHVRAVVEDRERRKHIRRMAARCRHFNKVVVIGNTPIDLEAELKIEELAQVVALALDFHAASLRPLVERSTMAGDDRYRALFIVNATSAAAQRAARPLLVYLRALNVFHIIHTTSEFAVELPAEAAASASKNYELFVSPQVSPYLQPLIDAPFFFDLAIALAYARGLTPAEIDRPRNLAKSVTTTGAERRSDVEARAEFDNVSLDSFVASPRAPHLAATAVSPIALALRAATALLAEPPPPELDLLRSGHLVVVADTEASENGANVAVTLWHELAGVNVTVYRRFLSARPAVPPDTAVLELVRAGAILAVPNAHTVAFPEDLTPLQLELLIATYLGGLALRLARQWERDTETWEQALRKLPLIVAGTLTNQKLRQHIRRALAPFGQAGYDKVQVIGGGQDFFAALSIARSLRLRGLVAEALYTDSAWHGPLAAVGGPDAEHDALIVILATDPLFQPAALVDTQVYRARHAPVILVVPQGNEMLQVVRSVDAIAVLAVTAVPRPFTPLVNAALGELIAEQMTQARIRTAAGHSH